MPFRRVGADPAHHLTLGDGQAHLGGQEIQAVDPDRLRQGQALSGVDLWAEVDQQRPQAALVASPCPTVRVRLVFPAPPAWLNTVMVIMQAHSIVPAWGNDPTGQTNVVRHLGHLALETADIYVKWHLRQME